MGIWRKRKDQLDWVYRINDPDTVQIGSNGELNKYIKEGELFLCVAYSGDYFEDYVRLTHSITLKNMLFSDPKVIIGSYGLGDATKIIKLDDECVRGALMGKVLIVPELMNIEL